MNKIIQCLLLSLLSGTCFAKEDFTFEDKPINPACVAMFNSSLADYPYINAINLNNCQHSNAAYQTTITNKDGSYSFYQNNKDATEGEYSYKVIGKTDKNIYVLQTQMSGGGTGVFNDLLLVQLKKNKIYSFERKAKPEVQEVTQLILLGTVLGGDRCVGAFTDLKVVGNTLQVKQYDGENASECDKQKEYSIDLARL